MLVKTRSFLSFIMGSTLIVGAGSQSVAYAAAADKGKKAVEGSVTCGGSYFIRNGGTEIQRSSYVIRNVSDSGSIYLNRVRVYSAQGNLLFDSDVSGIPASQNGVISAIDNSLDARQTADLALASLIPTQGSTTRPIQTVIDWSADEPILTLDAVNVRTNNDYDSTTGKIGTQRGRHASACRTTHIKKRW